jgi:16S rRNA (guanine527-N7)-methyltransferase
VFHDLGTSLGFELSSHQVELLERYEQLLATRAVKMGLVAESDRDRIRNRHVGDCLRAVPVLSAGDGLAVDLGSGAGLPGIVVAIAQPSLTVVLVESRRKRVGFLELAVAELGLANAEVLHGRVEEATYSADVCFARAFASLDRSWAVARRLLAPGGRLVYFAGAEGAVPEDLPFAANVRIQETGVVESGGPLVIITRE